MLLMWRDVTDYITINYLLYYISAFEKTVNSIYRKCVSIMEKFLIYTWVITKICIVLIE